MRITGQAWAMAWLLPWLVGLCYGENPPSAKPRTVGELTRQALSEDYDLRMEAVNALQAKGSAAQSAIPPLLKTVRDANGDLAFRAAQAMAAIDPSGESFMPKLIAGLRAGSEAERAEAARTLGTVCPTIRSMLDHQIHLRKTVGALTESLKDKAANVRRASAHALGAMDYTAQSAGPALAKLLKDDDVDVQWAAVKALGEIGSHAKPVLAALITALGGEDVAIREAAANAIGEIGWYAEEAVPALVRAIGDSEWVVRNSAVLALGKIGDAGAPAVRPLAEMLTTSVRNAVTNERKEDWPLRQLLQQMIPEVLGEIVGRKLRRFQCGSGATSIEGSAGGYTDPVADKKHVGNREVDLAVSALIVALEGPDVETAKNAAAGIAQIGPRAEKAVLALRMALTHKSPKVRANAAMALEYIGPAAKAAIPALRKALKDEDEDVRKDTARALYNVAPGSTEAAIHLVETLGDRSADVRHCAALALRNKVCPAVPLLIQALGAKDPRTARSAAFALGQFGAAARPALSVLTEALDRGDQELRWHAVRALAAMGQAALPAKPALMKVLASGDKASYGAIEGLVRMKLGKEDAEALAALDLPQTSYVAGKVFASILAFPGPALKFLQANPRAVWLVDRRLLCEIIDKTDPEYAALRKAVLDHPKLPSGGMAWSGDRRFLGVLRKRMGGANAYNRVFLAGCARACGQAPKKVVKVSADQPTPFIPPSAKAYGDRRRMPVGSAGGGHGDGTTKVIVTGRILMPDGTPAVVPKLIDSTDIMLVDRLMGRLRSDPLPIKYDAKTGRFVFFAQVFAAYIRGGREPGPYQTGAGEVLITAEGAEPFRFVFFDEMPEVEITLAPAKSSTSTHPIGYLENQRGHKR